MRRLIMWNLISLDGLFEGEKNWDLSFHERAWGPELEKLSLEQLDAADMLVFGRVTYEGMAVYYQGRLYAGSDAVNLLALLTTPVDLANRIAATVLGRPAVARALYPLLRAGRNVLLKLKGKPQLTR